MATAKSLHGEKCGGAAKQPREGKEEGGGGSLKTGLIDWTHKQKHTDMQNYTNACITSFIHI